MRINVYEEELTDDIQVVGTQASNTGITYYGVRVYLKSPLDLHHSKDDDDRSAVTFWVGSFENARQMAIAIQHSLEHIGVKHVANYQSWPAK